MKRRHYRCFRFARRGVRGTWTALLTLAVLAVLTACAVGDESAQQGNMSYNGSEPTVPACYEGVWTVGGVRADTVTVWLSADGRSWAVFSSFPLAAMTEMVAPSLAGGTITAAMPTDGAPTELHRLLAQTIEAGGGSDRCLVAGQRVGMLGVGYSETAFYMQMGRPADGATLSMPYVVTTAKGDTCVVVLDVSADQSTFVTDATSAMGRVAVTGCRVSGKGVDEGHTAFGSALPMNLNATRKR